jgi:hypothetical protein
VTRRYWTPAEEEYLAANYKRSSAREVGLKLGRSMKSVYHRAWLLGLMDARDPWTDDDEAELRRLNADGWSDTQVGERLGRDRHMVSKRRKRLGLPSHAHGEKAADLVRQGVRRQLDRAGLRNLAHLRLASWAERAAERGWPDQINGRPINMQFIQILDMLYERGPQTKLGIAEALGMRTAGESKSILKSEGKGGSYVAELMRAGLVVCLGRLAKGRGKGSSKCVYSLSMDVERNV